MEVKGNLVDIHKEEIYPARIIFDKKIKKIERIDQVVENFILPGLVDAHVHIESSLLVPSRFGQLIAVHGTVGVVTDPHEIANVLGIKGIEFMYKNSLQTPVKIFFTAPSCVPATKFETNGAKIGVDEIKELMQKNWIVALGEMMNYPGVINKDKEVLTKIEIAKKSGKPVDGHCPGLRGNELKKYIDAGITTDHECVDLEEAKEKAKLGMKIMIREGSSAKNLETLIDLIKEGYECFFVTDDIHAEDLIKGHINLLVKKAMELGIDPINAIKAASLNPISHYNLPIGLLREGDPADFIIVKDLKKMNVIETWIEGRCIAKEGKPLFEIKKGEIINNFSVTEKRKEDFVLKTKNDGKIKVRVIGVIDGQIVTEHLIKEVKVSNGKIESDTNQDIIKIGVVERYGHNNISLGFVEGFKIKNGAIASSVAHDSHNIVVVGSDDENITIAVNELIKAGGGLVVVSNKKVKAFLELPIAGLMIDENPIEVVNKLKNLHKSVRKIGCTLSAPFTTLSFLALPVIPKLKITDLGLFDVEKFKFTNLVIE